MRTRGHFLASLVVVSVAATSAAQARRFPYHDWHLQIDALGFGRALAVGPDLTGDGRPEILIGSIGDYDQRLSLHDGRTLATIYSIPSVVTINALGEQVETGMREALAWIDDLDGDGTPDFAHGAVKKVYSASGVYQFGLAGFVVRSGTTGSVIWENVEPSSLGLSTGVVAMHDVTGDGVGELLVNDRAGARIYDCVTQSLVATIPVVIPSVVYGLATTISAGGDVDGDGWPDLIVGHPSYGPPPQSGLFEVRSGDPVAGFPLIHHITGLPMEYQSPERHGILPDLDGDGCAEFFCAHNVSTASAYTVGVGVTILSGATAQPLFSSYQSDFVVGERCRAVPDITADGMPDLAVWGWLWPFSTQGALRFYDGSDFSFIREVEGAHPCHQLQSFDCLGDGNGDGFPEFVFGGAFVQGFPACTPATPSFGFVWIESLFGSDEYGDPSEHALTLSRQPYSNPFLGPLVVGGGTPNGAVSLVASYRQDDFIFPGTSVRVLLDVGAPLIFILDNLPLDANGGASFPLDLRNPLLDGTTVYLQAFDLPAGPQSSNAIAIRFGPQ